MALSEVGQKMLEQMKRDGQQIGIVTNEFDPVDARRYKVIFREFLDKGLELTVSMSREEYRAFVHLAVDVYAGD